MCSEYSQLYAISLLDVYTTKPAQAHAAISHTRKRPRFHLIWRVMLFRYLYVFRLRPRRFGARPNV